MTLSHSPQPSSELVFHFCGEPGLHSTSGGRIPLSRKAIALLAYLLMEPRAHSRQHLSALLWPESDEAKAATSLRQALTKLREVIGSRLCTDRNSVSIENPDSLRSDVGEFAMLVESDPLAAARVNVDEFLVQLTLSDGADYEHWTDRTRARLVRRAIDALRSDALQSVAKRDWLRVSELAGQWCRLDPESEAGVSLAIEAAFMRREVELGRALFEAFCRRQHRVHQAPPGESMQAMMQRLESLAHVMTPARGSTAISASSAHDSLVLMTSLKEREDQWRLLSDAYVRIQRDRRAETFLIHGDMGVGRSRLLQDAVAWMASQGATVLFARPALSNMALSYATLGTLLRSGIDAPGLGGIDGVYLRELMVLVPELSLRFPGIAPGAPPHGGPGWSLLEALSQALRALGEDAPVVLAIDDAMLCDRESGYVLQSLIEQLEHEPIMWLCTRCDDDGTTPASTLPAFLAALATSIALAPLSADSIAAMLRESSGLQDEWDVFVANLHSVTQGVPALVQAALCQLLTANQHDWQRVRSATVPVPVPTNSMLRRIESLTEMEREVLLALALVVEGLQLTTDEWKQSPTLTPHLLSHVHGISRMRAARISESLVEQRLARVCNGGLQCASPMIAKFMVTHGSSIMRTELRRRLRHVRRSGSMGGDVVIGAAQGVAD